MLVEEGAPACTRHLICSLPFLSLSFPIRTRRGRCPCGGGVHWVGLLGVPFPEEAPRSAPRGQAAGSGRPARGGAARRCEDGAGLSPQRLPTPCGGLWGGLGGAAGPLRASFWRRLGVIDRSLGNAIRLSGSEGRAGGGRAGEARGFLEAAPRRLARRSRAGAWLAGAGPGRADTEAQSPGGGGGRPQARGRARPAALLRVSREPAGQTHSRRTEAGL